MSSPDPTGSADHGEFEDRSAIRRTHLATERTQLAWWRTGLTALAVALAIGRVVPELQDASTQWPYTVVGVGFAVYAVLLIVYGTRRAREIDAAMSEGGWAQISGGMIQLLTWAGIVLGLATAVLIVVD
jgi:putative membrane protein